MKSWLALAAVAVATFGLGSAHAETDASGKAWLARFDSPSFDRADHGEGLPTYNPAEAFIERFAAPGNRSKPVSERANAGDPARAFIERLASATFPRQPPAVGPELSVLLAARR